jgi:predicted ArsR family transcriptional regulator
MQHSETAQLRTRKARSTTAAPEQPKSKKDQLVELLRTKTGADVKQLTEALGWLPHTVRAALTGLRKSGITVEKLPGKDGAPTRYRIATKRGRSAQ